MDNSDDKQNSKKPDKGTIKPEKKYLPDYVRVRSKYHKPPHLGTFYVWYGARDTFWYRHPLDTVP